MDKGIFLKDFKFITDIYNQFSPSRPLPANDPAYVVCEEVRGNDNIVREVGRKIIMSDTPTCQLYTGHRGSGKSTEIFRLQDYLEEQGCRVIYFEADEDMDLTDVSYPDILLSCTRNIMEQLKGEADANIVYSWMEEKFTELVDLGLTEVELEKIGINQQITPLTKITATLKATADKRRQIRKQVESYQVSFTNILNQFIKEAQENLKTKKQSKLVVIADNLDRIPPVTKENGINNHDDIFIDHSVQLKALNCHVVYTVPISLVYSNRSAILRENYGDTGVLPMIMIRDKQGNSYQKGIDKIKEVIKERIKFVANQFIKTQNLTAHVNQNIEITINDLFDSPETLNLLCAMTGGHVREIMLLMQESINWIDAFPLTSDAVKKAIATSRNTYENQVDNQDWSKLAEVSQRKKIINQDSYRQLLFSRCVLEYREADSLKVWHDVHPLIEEIDQFKDAVTRQNGSERSLSSN